MLVQTGVSATDDAVRGDELASAEDAGPPAGWTVRGACPSVHHPFAEADGLLVRVRLVGGVVTLTQGELLAALAAQHGSGIIEITNRGNLQIRGVGQNRLSAMIEALVDCGLADPDPEVDERRNVVAAPAAGIDPDEVLDIRSLAAQMASALASSDLPLAPRDGVLIDGGGAISLRGRRHRVALGAVRHRTTNDVLVEVRSGMPLPLKWDGPVPVVSVDGAVAAALSILGADDTSDAIVRRVDPSDLERAEPTTIAPIGIGSGFVGAAPLLGRLDTRSFTDVVAAVRRSGADSIRLTPWRSILVPDTTDPTVLDELAIAGLIVSPNDPALGVIACSGNVGCVAGLSDTQSDARAIIADLRARDDRRTFHLSGCDKRCASRTGEHDVTLIANRRGGYDRW